MARIRTIKPDFWMNEDLAQVSEAANLMAIGLLNHSDDEGYFRANPALVKAAVFPLREPSVNIHGMFTELSNIGYIELFEGSDGKRYGFVVGFTKHQKVNRPQPSKIKALRQITEDSVNDHGTFTGGKEQGTGKGKDNNNSSNRRSIPLDFYPEDQDFQLLRQKGITMQFIKSQIEEFIMYWDETGTARNDWRAAFRNRVADQWLKQYEGNGKSGAGTTRSKQSHSDFMSGLEADYIESPEGDSHVVPDAGNKVHH